ncbi:diacylglycerol/lipid kinase family protein [Alkaliphilus serpentinus]|uniref:YegS/Rv2252/BmrU family lipid kinase n=1 Tax=Alkaliphilus serpentinus TaxID=1482731 RepID=A0A833HMY4_9FIRM|nr:YegS/Rv2252/BmrU family lipid kinase [Alkaliphilus serpentinus]KAB3529033.1 YegS/Rv2252/BmrU family lipid kinase [Alkaliphilus serpentinus]
MKRVKIIYNPDSGRRALRKTIPELEDILTNEFKFIVDKEATEGKNHGREIAYKTAMGNYDLIVAAGGDGTVNEVVNGIMESGQKIQLAIYPAGTVNDFGCHLNIPRNIRRFAEMIYEGRVIDVDIGLAGDRYFLNVAAGGLLTDVAHYVSSDAKTVLGKFAYYFEGIKVFPKQMFKSLKIQLKVGGLTEEKDILFFLLANSTHVGGFKRIASEAKINDGFMDLILVENSHIIDAANLFFLMLQGNHVSHNNITYLHVKEFRIMSKEKINIDIDGEMGGTLPMTFKVIQEAIPMIVPMDFKNI